MTNPNQLPDTWLRAIVAPDFDTALAECERRYGPPVACWQYGNNFYFEAQP
jgi:acyl-homoserine lactone acylase PvdQ